PRRAVGGRHAHPRHDARHAAGGGVPAQRGEGRLGGDQASGRPSPGAESEIPRDPDAAARGARPDEVLPLGHGQAVPEETEAISMFHEDIELFAVRARKLNVASGEKTVATVEFEMPLTPKLASALESWPLLYNGDDTPRQGYTQLKLAIG